MKSTGKRIFYIVFINMCLFFFAGCGDGGSYPSSSGGQVEQQPTRSSFAATTASLDEKIENQMQYKMAFILLTVETDPMELIETRLNHLAIVKEHFSQSFHYATLGHVSMDTSYDVIPISIEPENIKDIGSDTAFFQKFYEDHPDEFDFISIFHDGTFSCRMYHSNIKNQIEGIGLREYDFSTSYGSQGRLLGINIIPYIPNTTEEIEILSISALLHETGHQWGVYIGDNFKNDINLPLEIKQQAIHFYRGLESPYPTGTPMGSDRWIPNGDGTYHRENLQDIAPKYHPIQLYLMGILTPENFDFNTKFKIFNTGGGDSGTLFDPENAVLYKEISINDIIDVEGEIGYF